MIIITVSVSAPATRQQRHVAYRRCSLYRVPSSTYVWAVTTNTSSTAWVSFPFTSYHINLTPVDN